MPPSLSLTNPRRYLLRLGLLFSVLVLFYECSYVLSTMPRRGEGGTLGSKVLASVVGSGWQSTGELQTTAMYQTAQGFVEAPPHTCRTDPNLFTVYVYGRSEPVGLWAGEMTLDTLSLGIANDRAMPSDGSLHAAYMALLEQKGAGNRYPADFAKGDLHRTSIRWVGLQHDAITLVAICILWGCVRGKVKALIAVFRRPGTCTSCGYCLDGLMESSRCPECGINLAA